MADEITIFVPAMRWTGDEPVYGIERAFVVQMLYQAVLDARAIARRDAWYFKELRVNDKARKHQFGGMWVIEEANRRLRTWLDCDQFTWYCELLHWEAARVRLTIIGIIDGQSYDELRDHLKMMGALGQQEKNDGIAARVSQKTVCPMWNPEVNHYRIQVAVREQH